MNGNVTDRLLEDFFALAKQTPIDTRQTTMAVESLEGVMTRLGETVQETVLPAATTAATVVPMPSTATPRTILDEIQSVVAPSTGAFAGLGNTNGLAGQIDLVRAATPMQSTGESTKESGGLGETALSVMSTVFKSGLGLSPVLRTLFGLFGSNDDDATPAPLLKYTLPAAVQFQAALTADGIGNADYDQSGMARQYQTTRRDSDARSTAAVTVNVQAMDARSFLDRSTEIAAAVREAMLNLNSINDVVADL